MSRHGSGRFVELLVASLLSALLVSLISAQSLDPNSPYSGRQTEYTRPNADLDLHLDEPEIAPNPLGGPEQVFLSQADNDGNAFTISWSSNRSMDSVVSYSEEAAKFDQSAKGSSSKYKYADYTSGNLHHVTISDLKHNTLYYYKIGDGDEPHLTFKGQFTTPPPPGPNSSIKFAVVGDLGQTYSSNKTLSHINSSGGQYLLNVGDFSYADNYQPRWDTWGRFMTRYCSKIPMVFCYGNHEIEYDRSLGATKPHDGFLAVNTRFAAPWNTSRAVSPIYYSLNVGPAHIISLNSYIAVSTYSPQHAWLMEDLASVDRSVTPWVIIITHVPWYNTYNAHYMEGEAIRSAVEHLARKYKVDLVLSGHVHAYERFRRSYEYEEDQCAPMHITIGDGGNREGPAYEFQVVPQPHLSLFREPSFGHGTLEIFNGSVALWQWHRNEDTEGVVADQVYIENLASNACSGKLVLDHLSSSSRRTDL